MSFTVASVQPQSVSFSCLFVFFVLTGPEGNLTAATMALSDADVQKQVIDSFNLQNDSFISLSAAKYDQIFC